MLESARLWGALAAVLREGGMACYAFPRRSHRRFVVVVVVRPRLLLNDVHPLPDLVCEDFLVVLQLLPDVVALSFQEYAFELGPQLLVLMLCMVV